MSMHDPRAAENAAFALDVLEPDETRAHSAHLRDCPECRADLDDFRVTVGLLGLGVPQVAPPASLKQALMREVRGEVVPRRRSFWRALQPIAAVALVVLAVSGWGWGLRQQQQLAPVAEQARQVQAERDALARLIQAGNMRTLALRGDDTAPDATGEVTIAPDEPVALLRVTRMPPLARDRIYQVWLIRDGTRVSGGLFVVDASGSGEVIVHAPEALGTYQALGITAEPAGGSPGPTSPRVIGGRL